MELNLKRPIAFFDLETTGLNTAKDRIIEISIVKINTNGSQETKTWLINPDYPISAEASSVHGYTNEDMVKYPTFKQVGREISKYLDHCNLSGYNCLKFDIPMLVEEFLRADVDFEVKNRKFIDVQNIFMKMEQRTLAAASKFYLKKELIGAHSAEVDATATYEILKAQLDKYNDTEFTDREGNISKPVVNDMEALSEFATHHRNADLMGQFIYDKEDREVINFGKYKGKTVEEVFTKDPSYYNWMMKADFPLYTKKLITAIKFRMAQA